MTVQKRILVVDDEERWRRQLSGYLSRRGLRVDLASSRMEAEELLEKNVYDFVLSDNKMEQRNAGLGLCAWMHYGPAPLSTIPFVLHTADEASELKDKLKELGAMLCEKDNQNTLMATIDALLAM